MSAQVIVVGGVHLPSFQERTGLWAEHGHQPDSFNRDENPSSGHQLTQAAFFQPDVRRFEGPGGWATSMGDGKGIQRVISIRTRPAIGACSSTSTLASPAAAST